MVFRDTCLELLDNVVIRSGHVDVVRVDEVDVFPSFQTSGLEHPIDILESQLNLPVDIVAVEITEISPATLSRTLYDVPGKENSLRVVAKVAVFLTSTLFVDIGQRR